MKTLLNQILLLMLDRVVNIYRYPVSNAAVVFGMVVDSVVVVDVVVDVVNVVNVVDVVDVDK